MLRNGLVNSKEYRRDGIHYVSMLFFYGGIFFIVPMQYHDHVWSGSIIGPLDLTKPYMHEFVAHIRADIVQHCLSVTVEHNIIFSITPSPYWSYIYSKGMAEWGFNIQFSERTCEFCLEPILQCTCHGEL